MRKTFAGIFVLILLFATVITKAQMVAKENNYYIVIANTDSIVKNNSNPLESKLALPIGSKILVLSVENNEIYFRITLYDDANCNNCYKENDLYSTSVSEFSGKNFRLRAGFSGGLLNAPFKYRPDKDKIYPGGNLAYYGSWFINLAGFEFKPLVFAGITTITITDINVASKDTETKVGYTMGIGVGIDVLQAFDLGAVAGWDFVDREWESDGRIWYAVSFNFGI